MSDAKEIMQCKLNYNSDVNIFPLDVIPGLGTYDEGTCFFPRAPICPRVFGETDIFLLFSPACLSSAQANTSFSDKCVALRQGSQEAGENSRDKSVFPNNMLTYSVLN